MKTIITNNFLKSRQTLFTFLILASVFAFYADADAQVRHGHDGRRVGFTHIPFHSFGIRHSHHFAPRIGARFRVLPFGYTSFWIGGIPYYYYDGFYYQYYPEDGVYVVVEKPNGADTVQSLKFDQVKLYDGSTLEGVFEGATNSSVTLRIGNDDHDIKISDIVSITFAQSIQDSTQVK